MQSQFHQSENNITQDLIWVQKAKEHPAHFEALYNKYYEQILKYVYQRVESKEEAYDITAQVFTKAMLHLSNYEFKGLPFSAWLYRIAANELNMLFRKNKVQHVINADINSLHQIKEEIHFNEDDEEKINLILSEISNLNEDEIQLIEMRFFEKRSFKEISEILDITENNAKVKTYRVLDKLKEKLLKKN
ncbi:MAG: sigma-70 family RNA polymerase sigma factor [Bacteroidota bacterium]